MIKGVPEPDRKFRYFSSPEPELPVGCHRNRNRISLEGFRHIWSSGYKILLYISSLIRSVTPPYDLGYCLDAAAVSSDIIHPVRCSSSCLAFPLHSFVDGRQWYILCGLYFQWQYFLNCFFLICTVGPIVPNVFLKYVSISTVWSYLYCVHRLSLVTRIRYPSWRYSKLDIL